MPSIVRGYEYDIFISYRHNDNAYDGWVSEFVEKLRRELVATVKDKLTIYFDENPGDGLHESHQVDQSLSSKINSLIFIPIVSQTYCDTTSFAWNSEFLAFSRAASQDKLGREIRLLSGNVSSRILPIRIHELERDDVQLFEKVLAGTLRSIDFIYQAQGGVNRPLRPKDDDLIDNLNNTIYRNQINKVANAIKDILQGIKAHQQEGATPVASVTEQKSEQVLTVPNVPRWYNTTIPSEIRVAVLDIPQPTVFLAWTSNELKAKREEMALILTRAGFKVVPNHDCPSSDDEFKNNVKRDLETASCSLHILGSDYGRRFEDDEDKSFPKHQFEVAKSKSATAGSKFVTFIWNIEDPTKPVKAQQAEFINEIRNNITSNMIFTNAFSPMQLVEDMRSLLVVEESKKMDTKDTDIYFIFNKQDAKDAYPLTDLISEHHTVEVLNILPGGEEQYREMSTQQIPKSKLAVIYFRYGADWAMPFIKQVWKEVGGASSPTQLMLIGENDPQSNLARIFKAPKVTSTIVSKDEVPVVVKSTFVKVTS